MMARRKIVQIDEEKCNGCGLCVPSCAEGAIQIVEGKARLVSDVYCDGLGACLGHCPQGAISIIEREAQAFDEAAASAHASAEKTPHHAHAANGSCPGAAAMQLRLNVLAGGNRPRPAAPQNQPAVDALSEDSPSRLANWPVQLHLVPVSAPYLHHADLLLVADCVPFAYADFHRRFLDGRPVAIGCPKLDQGQLYVEKLAQIIRQCDLRSITVVHMQVPCCSGLVRIAQAAIQASEVEIPLHHVIISIHGEVLTADPVAC